MTLKKHKRNWYPVSVWDRHNVTDPGFESAFVSFSGEIIKHNDGTFYRRASDGWWLLFNAAGDLIGNLRRETSESIEAAFQQYKRDLVDLILEEP